MRGKTCFHTKAIGFFIVLSLLFSPFYSLTPEAIALSIEDEKKMGQEFLAQIKKHYELLDDDFVNRYL